MATEGRLYTGGKGRVGVYEATYIMAAHVHTIRTTKPNGTTFFTVPSSFSPLAQGMTRVRM